MKNINNEIANYIIEERKRLRLTRSDLAEKLQVRNFDIAQWESNKHDFTVSELCKISTVLDISKFIKELI